MSKQITITLTDDDYVDLVLACGDADLDNYAGYILMEAVIARLYGDYDDCLDQIEYLMSADPIGTA